MSDLYDQSRRLLERGRDTARRRAPHVYASIEHLGVLVGGGDDVSEDVRAAGPSTCVYNLEGIGVGTCAQIDVLDGPLVCDPPVLEIPDGGSVTFAAAWSPSSGITCGTVRSRLYNSSGGGIVNAGVWLGGASPIAGYQALWTDADVLIVVYLGFIVAVAFSVPFVEGMEIFLTVNATGAGSAGIDGVTLCTFDQDPAAAGFAGVVGETRGHSQTLSIQDCRCA